MFAGISSESGSKKDVDSAYLLTKVGFISDIQKKYGTYLATGAIKKCN
jgi:hypothetical protein